jgi:hypothetical protein
MLMTLCILISSGLIYNTTGAIEESSLDDLAVLTKIAEDIYMKNKQ